MDFKKGFALLDVLIGLSILFPLTAFMVTSLVNLEKQFKVALSHFTQKAPHHLHQTGHKNIPPKIQAIKVDQKHVFYVIK